jgi:hypothetical protein
VNLDQLDPDVLGAIRQNLGAQDEDDESKDSQIATMPPLEAFNRFLEWEGIIGYGATIWAAVENIKDAAGETDSSAAGKEEDAGE